MESELFIGILFGFILQRGQFCFVSGFKTLYIQKNLRFLTALFVAISIQSVGLFSLAQFDVIQIPTSQTPLLASLLGGFLFGIGMVLANCCGSGSWFRSGEGAMGSLIVLLSFALTMATTQTGALKFWINKLTAEPLNADNIHHSLGISPWWLVAILVLFTLWLSWRYLQNPSIQSTSKSAVIFPRVFGNTWSPFTTAIALGLLSLIAWYLSAQTGRNFSFGVSVPSANVVQYLVIGQQRYLNWGSYFVLGIPLGAFISAKLSGEFQWQTPDATGVLRRLFGGFVMGIGAALAGGCTVTNSLVATAYFSWQGWLATLMIFLGCVVAMNVFKLK